MIFFGPSCLSRNGLFSYDYERERIGQLHKSAKCQWSSCVPVGVRPAQAWNSGFVLAVPLTRVATPVPCQLWKRAERQGRGETLLLGSPVD